MDQDTPGCCGPTLSQETDRLFLDDDPTDGAWRMDQKAAFPDTDPIVERTQPIGRDCDGRQILVLTLPGLVRSASTC